MLHFLRKSVKSLPAKILIGLLVASFAVWGIGDVFRFNLDSRVAKVGNTEISAARFAEALQREQLRISQQAREQVSFERLRAAGIDLRILAALARDAALKEELDRLGISAPDAAVAEAIRTDPTFQDVAGKFSAQAYQLLLAREGMSRSTFESNRRTLLAQGILTGTAQAGLVPPPGAAARIAAWQGESRIFTTLTLTLDMTPDPGDPDPSALNAFYDANPALFTEPERRTGEYIHVNPVTLLETLRPDDDTLREHYQSSLDRYSIQPTRMLDQISYPSRADAETAMQRLLSGDADYDALGAAAGLDAATMSLGVVRSDELPTAAADAVFSSTEAGIVGPVELPAGAAIYRIREVSEGGAAAFEDVRELIAAEQAQAALQYRAPEIANQIEEFRAEGLTFAQIAEKAGAEYGNFDGLARDGSLSDGTDAQGVQTDDSFLTEAFTALDTEERDLVELPGGGFILVMIHSIAPAELMPLDSIRDRATAEWQTAERRKSLEAQGAEMAARLGEDASIWDIGEELGLAATPHPAFTQMTAPANFDPELAEALFRTGLGAGISAATGNGDQVIIGQVSNVTPLAPEAIARNAASIDNFLTASLQRDMGEYFARAIEASYPAQLDAGVIEEVFGRLGATSGGAIQ